MSEVYESIMNGLNEVLDDVSGKTKAKRKVIEIIPVKEYTAKEIKKIRKANGFTQTMLAAYLGVSKKTVEAWEAGTNHPSGAASRLLQLLEGDPSFVQTYPFIKVSIQ